MPEVWKCTKSGILDSNDMIVRWVKMLKVKKGQSALCSYCRESATFRIGNDEYALHACDRHEDSAYNEFDLVSGEDTWRIISMASHGFPEQVII